MVMNIKEQLQTRLQLKEGAEVEYKSVREAFLNPFGVLFLHLPIPMVVIWCWGLRKRMGGFVPDGLTEKQITDYRKKFWDEAHNKACAKCTFAS